MDWTQFALADGRDILGLSEHASKVWPDSLTHPDPDPRCSSLASSMTCQYQSSNESAWPHSKSWPQRGSVHSATSYVPQSSNRCRLGCFHPIYSFARKAHLRRSAPRKTSASQTAAKQVEDCSSGFQLSLGGLWTPRRSFPAPKSLLTRALCQS